MNIQDALKETGRAVRACWTNPKEGDCVTVNLKTGELLYYVSVRPVSLDVILADDWIPYPKHNLKRSKKLLEGREKKEYVKMSYSGGLMGNRPGPKKGESPKDWVQRIKAITITCKECGYTTNNFYGFNVSKRICGRCEIGYYIGRPSLKLKETP